MIILGRVVLMKPPESWDCSNTNGSPNFINDESLSNNDIFNSKLKIYPNPVNDRVFISGDLDKANIEIYNAIGQLVLKENQNSSVNVVHLKKGLYFIKIIGENKKTTLKFIKN